MRIGLRLRRSPGLANVPITTGTAARPSQRAANRDPFAGRQWHAPEYFRLTVARRRRIFTVFPYAESQVIVDGAA